MVAVAAMAALLPAACGTSADLIGSDAPTTPTRSTLPESSSPTTQSADPPSGDLQQFYGQQVAWQDCGSFECATVTVPLDYDDVTAGTVDLELRKAPATEDEPLGTLFINPGGPGGSGITYLDFFLPDAPELQSAYDIVGFDPRGVGVSDPVTCLSDGELDDFIAYDPDPDTAAEVRRATALVRKLGRACQANTGPLAGHVSTVEVAKDLDILRAVVGDQKMHYYGASYGTFIGATYAELFPDKVDRMVLDGALDPALSIKELNLQQAAGFETALNAYVDDCIAGGGCPLGEDKQAALDRIKAFLDGLDADPLESGDSDRPLTEGLGFYGIAVTLYNQDYWTILSSALAAGLAGDGSQLLQLADAYLDRGPDGTYNNNSAQVIYAVNCLDKPVDVSVPEIQASESEYEEVAPVFGRVFAWSLLGCSNWPVQSAQKPLTIDADGAAPIVVVGTTRDPATPYQWAEALADELESGVLVSRDGDGHTGYHMGNECVDDAIDAYLVDGTVPINGLQC